MKMELQKRMLDELDSVRELVLNGKVESLCIIAPRADGMDTRLCCDGDGVIRLLGGLTLSQSSLASQIRKNGHEERVATN